MSLKNITIYFLFIIIILNLILPNHYFLQADTNTPQDKSNGWWNTTAGSDWVINTTNNLWENKNISVLDSIQIEDGGIIVFQNCSLLINKNIIVENNATLELINTTLLFNGSNNGSTELQVLAGGSLYISDYDNNPVTTDDASIITSSVTDNEHRYLIYIYRNSNLTMINSEIHQCGYSLSPTVYGFNIKADDTKIENNTFSENFAGLILESSNNTIKNNDFYDNDQFGLLMFMGRNNTLSNNLIHNNTYNFGLLVNGINQTNQIYINNKINNDPLYYFEDISNYDLNSNQTTPGFIGFINSTNISIIKQDLRNNFNSILLFGGNNSIIIDSNITNNFYGILAELTKNLTITNSNIKNNSFVGLSLVSKCFNVTVINSSFENNTFGIQALNSNVLLINTSINLSNNFDLELDKGSYIKTINCTFQKSKVQITDSASVLEKQDYLHIQTKNHTGYPIGNVSFNLYDGNNNFLFNGTTNKTGAFNWIPCTSYEITKLGVNYSKRNHRINTKYAGINTNQYVLMNKSKTVIIELNHPPIIVDPPKDLLYIDEESYYSFNFTYFDQDLDNITWNSDTNASWLNLINSSTGFINGTPTDPDIGQFYLNITCHDDYFGWTFYNFTLIVNNTNDPPEIISKQGATVTYEDVDYIHDFDVFDPDKGDKHNWSMMTNAQWLRPIHKSTGQLFGRPTQKDVGEYFVNITCTDVGSFKDVYNFSLKVLPINDPPFISNPIVNIILVDEDSDYYYDFNYYDDDKTDTVQWSSFSNASWLEKINASTGIIKGTPHDYDIGIFFVNISCQDTNDSRASLNYSIKVRNTNDPPNFIGVIPNTISAYEDNIFEYSFSIFDPDKIDNFKFKLKLEDFIPNKSSNSNSLDHSWLNIRWLAGARTCTVYGTPLDHDVGLFIYNLTCLDDIGEKNHINFKVLVENTNDPPIITNPESDLVFALEDQEYYYDFDFYDIDGDNVTWTLKSNALWLDGINTTTGMLSGIPRQEDLDIYYYVDIICTDPYGSWNSQNYTIQVNNTNDPPIISNPCPKTVYVDEDVYYDYDFNSNDRDSKTIYWSSKSDASWLGKIHLFTGIISGTPLNDDVGQYFVNISCRDDDFDWSYYNYSIIVRNTNDAPEITNAYEAPITIDVGSRYSFNFTFFDADGDGVNWNLKTNATHWLNLNTESGELFGTPYQQDIGSYYINVSCFDANDGLTFIQYYIKVSGIKNRPPELFNGHVEPAKGDIETNYTFYVTYRDADNDEPFTVLVLINNTPFQMKHTSGDNMSIGVVYTYSTQLPRGIHSYYFQATDKLYAKFFVSDNTPTDQNPNTVLVEEYITEEPPQEKFDYTFIIWIIIIVIIIVVIAVIYMQSRNRRFDKELQREISKPIIESEKEPTEITEQIKTKDATPSKKKKQDKIKKPVKEKHEISKVDKKKKKDSKEQIKTRDDEIEMAEVEEISDLDEIEAEVADEDLEEEKPVIEDSEPVDIEEPIEEDREPIKDDLDSELGEAEHEGGGDGSDSKGSDLMICPECGEFISGTLDNCPGCGVNFVYDTDSDVDMESKETSAQDVEDSDKHEHDLMVCPECGEFVNETFKSCPSCGVNFVFDTDAGKEDDSDDDSSIDELEDSDEHEHVLMVCPECGEFVNETFDSCPNCGVKFVFSEGEDQTESSGELEEDSEDKNNTDDDEE